MEIGKKEKTHHDVPRPEHIPVKREEPERIYVPNWPVKVPATEPQKR